MVPLNSKSLLYFKTVCDLGTIRHAATVLKIAPSAISRHITLLEKTLAVELFVRSKNTMNLTPYGQQLFKYVCDQAHKQNILLKDFNNIQTSNLGTITIAMGGGFIQDAIQNVIVPLQKKHKNIKISVIIESLQGISRCLQTGTADIGLTYNVNPSKDFKLVHSVCKPMCVIMSASHKMAGLKFASIKDFINENIAMADKKHSVTTTIMQNAKIQDAQLNIALTVNSLSALIDCVCMGNYVCFLPEFCVQKYISSGDLVAIPLTDTGLSNTYTNILFGKDAYITPLMQKTLDLIVADMEAFK